MEGAKQPRLVGGTYLLEEKLGAGAMGAVFAARDQRTGADVALKLLHPHLAEGAKSSARFGREASLATRLDHPGIVRVLDAGADPEDGTLYVAMERLRGYGLDARMARPGLSQLDLLQMAGRLCGPLAAAHAAGIVHRDLKPDNVFVHCPSGWDGREWSEQLEQLKLLDFGIARELGGESLTGTHAGLGTPYYMAPEQATDARRVGPPADVWSLGVILYRYLSGLLPFRGDGPFDTVLAAITTEPAPLPVPAPLAELVMVCLAKAPEDRPADAEAAGARIEALLADPELVLELEQNPLPPIAPIDRPTPLEGGTSGGAVGDAAKALLAQARARASEASAPPPPAASRSNRMAILLGCVAVASVAGLGLLLGRAPGPAPLDAPPETPVQPPRPLEPSVAAQEPSRAEPSRVEPNGVEPRRTEPGPTERQPPAPKAEARRPRRRATEARPRRAAQSPRTGEDERDAPEPAEPSSPANSTYPSAAAPQPAPTSPAPVKDVPPRPEPAAERPSPPPTPTPAAEVRPKPSEAEPKPAEPSPTDFVTF